MNDFDLTLDNLGELFPDNFSEEQIARAKTNILKELPYRSLDFTKETI